MTRHDCRFLRIPPQGWQSRYAACPQRTRRRAHPPHEKHRGRDLGSTGDRAKPISQPSQIYVLFPAKSLVFTVIFHKTHVMVPAWHFPTHLLALTGDSSSVFYAQPSEMDDLQTHLCLQALTRNLASGDPQFCAV